MEILHSSFDPASVCDESLVHLADGATVRLRAASRDGHDDDALRRLFFTFSDTTRYQYFCAGVPSNETWAERFMALRQRRRGFPMRMCWWRRLITT